MSSYSDGPPRMLRTTRRMAELAGGSVACRDPGASRPFARRASSTPPAGIRPCFEVTRGNRARHRTRLTRSRSRNVRATSGAARARRGLGRAVVARSHASESERGRGGHEALLLDRPHRAARAAHGRPASRPQPRRGARREWARAGSSAMVRGAGGDRPRRGALDRRARVERRTEARGGAGGGRAAPSHLGRRRPALGELARAPGGAACGRRRRAEPRRRARLRALLRPAHSRDLLRPDPATSAGLREHERRARALRPRTGRR